jgi:hypothetical protein
VKRAAIAFLEARGLEDEAQAEVAIAILGDVVRTRTIDDRERVLQALTRIHLRYPTLPSPLRLRDAS